MSCKLSSNITKDNCNYALSGVKAIYLLNYDNENAKIEESPTTKGISSITLPAGEKIHKIDFVNDTASFSDELATNGNGGKYRTHTVNFTIDEYGYTVLNQDKALSLGRFVAIMQDKQGRCFVLGRNNGLTATSFNYASGAADADANGWTVVMAGTEIEMAKPLDSYDVIKDLVDDSIMIP